MEKGMLVVVSGPSGVGKGTICGKVLAADKRMVFSVSATTRAPRPGEIDGVHYFFKTPEEFQKMIDEGGFLEYMQVFGKHSYGTPCSYVEEKRNAGFDVVLDIDVKGAEQVKRLHPEAVSIFILPPSMATLKERLINRNTESMADVERRYAQAKEEIPCSDSYDYVIINDDLEKAIEDMRHIIAGERLRSSRSSDFINSLKEEISQ